MSFRWLTPTPSDDIPAGGVSPTFLIPCRGAEYSGPVGQPDAAWVANACVANSQRGGQARPAAFSGGIA